MIRFAWLAVLAVLAVGPLGCAKSDSAGGTAQAPAGSAPAGSAPVAAAPKQQLPPPAASTPGEAVQSFLEAVRLGNDEQAGQMLTATARQKTAELNMVVAPPGSDTASYKIGEVRAVGNDGAHVASSWTDMDQERNKRTDQITWILRKQPEGWRIAGMATKIFPDQEPVVLNFENPQDMLERQRVAEEEAFRRANQNQQQAARPEDPFQTPKRQ